MENELIAFFERVRPAIQSVLHTLLPASSLPPSQIHEAMRYSTLDGGKQFRPCLCVAGYSIYKDDWVPILRVAAAIEMIHSYSLIHDDLPAMDDDDERRGKPACHRKFNEAIAILAGDALLTLAFEVLSQTKEFPPDRILRAISVLGRASGTREGMIAGQVLDLQAEGLAVTPSELESIHRSKTGALIGSAVWIGAYLGGASDAELELVTKYGDRVGLAFQVFDDIDDEVEGRDRGHGKATYPAMHGMGKSCTIAHELLQSARHAVGPLGERARILIDFCDYLENR